MVNFSSSQSAFSKLLAIILIVIIVVAAVVVGIIYASHVYSPAQPAPTPTLAPTPSPTPIQSAAPMPAGLTTSNIFLNPDKVLIKC